MDELELLKKDWKKRENELPHFEASQLYAMLLKKSSSIVKWIFIISLIELFICTFLNFYLTDDAYWKQVETIHLKKVTIGIYIFSYLLTFTFIYFFYKNYKKISTTDSALQLMQNILKTRKVVKTYVLIVLISNGIVLMLTMVFTILYSPKLKAVVPAEGLGWSEWAGILFVGFIAALLFVGALLGIYYLLYGILLRKLNRNYKELKKLKF